MIKVKKLVWYENNYKDGFDTLTTKKYHIHRCVNKFRIEIDGEFFMNPYTLQEAQDILQMYWDEYVLSLVEE